jgi:hypothetical protein
MFDVNSLVKYILEGLAVALAAFYIPQRKVSPSEIATIALTAAAAFAVLDMFSPGVAAGARQGTGFGIGYNITRGIEGFEDDTANVQNTNMDHHVEQYGDDE